MDLNFNKSLKFNKKYHHLQSIILLVFLLGNNYANRLDEFSQSMSKLLLLCCRKMLVDYVNKYYFSTKKMQTKFQKSCQET